MYVMDMRLTNKVLFVKIALPKKEPKSLKTTTLCGTVN